MNLNDRKQLLLLESNLHRTLIRAEYEAGCARIDSLKNSFGAIQNLRAMMDGFVPRPALFVASGVGRVASWVALGVSAWKLFESIKALRISSTANQKGDSPAK